MPSKLLLISLAVGLTTIRALGEAPRVVETDRGMVVAAERLAAESGAAVLREGGTGHRTGVPDLRRYGTAAVAE